jgi:hypothetical protein
MVLGQPGQKKSLQDPISAGRKVGLGGTCLSSQQWQSVYNRKTVVHTCLGKKQDPISRITRTKKGVDAWLKQQSIYPEGLIIKL